MRKRDGENMNEKMKRTAKRIMKTVANSDSFDIETYFGFYKPKKPAALNKKNGKVNK